MSRKAFNPFLRVGTLFALYAADMSRARRVIQHEFPYSVTTRCNNKEFFLKKEEAYFAFERVFAKLKKMSRGSGDSHPKYEFQVHHLEVMHNHYHLIISVSSRTSIDKIMQQINSMVARFMNKALGRTGHFWGGRYKSKILNGLDYLKNTILYVYQNPLRARVITSLRNYSRSTLQYYFRKILPAWLTPDPFLATMNPADWPALFEAIME
jgi:putative transposase